MEAIFFPLEGRRNIFLIGKPRIWKGPTFILFIIFANQLNENWQIFTRLNNCFLPIITHFMCLKLEKTSSSLHKIMISYNNLLESHFDGNYYLLQIFQLVLISTNHKIVSNWTVLGLVEIFLESQYFHWNSSLTERCAKVESFTSYSKVRNKCTLGCQINESTRLANFPSYLFIFWALFSGIPIIVSLLD